MSWPGADHLRDHVEGHHDQRAAGREDADRRLAEAVAGHVGKGELAQVAQPLGHQEGDDGPADEPADREDQAVEAIGEHQARNAQERRRRHVVAGDRQAVLEAGDAAAGGVEVGRALGLGRRPLGDEQRDGHESAEHADGRPVGGLLGGLAEIGAGRVGAHAHRGDHAHGQHLGQHLDGLIVEAHFTTPLTICSVSESNSLFARRM